MHALQPGVVKDAIQIGKLVDHSPGYVPHGAGVRDVENERPHPRVRLADRLQDGFPSAGDDDPVAEPMKRLGQALANARAAARDQDRVGVHSHRKITTRGRNVTRKQESWRYSMHWLPLLEDKRVIEEPLCSRSTAPAGSAEIMAFSVRGGTRRKA
jgi:hypothetical protein